MTDCIPFSHHIFQFSQCFICTQCFVQLIDLFDQCFFSGQICLFYALLGGNIFIFLFEEIITGRNETFPYNIRVLAGNRTDRFPFFLESDHLFSRTLPFYAVFQCFCFLTQGFFQFEILFHLFLDILVESAFLVEIYITGSAEAFENLYIGFFRCETDCFPFIL